MQGPVDERKAKEGRNVGGYKDQMNCQHPFAEPPLKNVSNKLPEASGKSTDTEKGFVPSTSELNLMVHKTLQTEDPLAPG